MHTVNIARVSGAEGEPASERVTLHLHLEDGSPLALSLSAGTASALMTTANRVLRELADAMKKGALGAEQIAAVQCESVLVAPDLATRSGLILFDHGKPSQTAYLLNETQLDELGRSLAETCRALSDEPPSGTRH
jgi:hypothetical protein